MAQLDDLWWNYLYSDNVILIIDVLEGRSINLRDCRGATVLQTACHKGYTNCIEFAINAGADIWMKCGSGMTALHYACMHGSLATIELLLQLGAHVNAR